MAATQVMVGNYVIERELGRGGMGVVYAAHHRVLGRRAAIKLLADPAQDVERFFNEGRAAMAIEHPGVVRVYDVGRANDGRAYIAMELLDGDSLAQRLKRSGVVPVRSAVNYARQIAEALSAVHAVQIVHRDLKPENVIVVEGDRVKLVDFGVAKLVGQLAGGVKTISGALIGTPNYMSPEQCEGVRELDARSDLYSLGCVLYAMLTGAPPFSSTGVGALIAMHLYEPVPPLRTKCPSAAPELEALVNRLLAKAPEDRYADARAVVDALSDPALVELASTQDAAATAALPVMTTTVADRLAPQPAETPPPHVSLPMIATTQRPPRARRWLVPALAACAAAATIVVFAWTREPAHEPVIAQQPPAPDAAVVVPVVQPDAPSPEPEMVTITLEGAPPNTEVLVHGKLYGVAPQVELPRGTRPMTIVLSRDGYRSRSLPVTPDRDQRIQAKLIARRTAKPVTPDTGEPTQNMLDFPNK
ncbi:MAG: serine/threonine-protein kinase [Kofleriaceae bacterium]